MLSPSSSYIAKEESATRKPAELYRFWRTGLNGTLEWTYTSGDVAIVHGGKTYAPAPLSRGQITQDSEIKASQLTINADYLADALVSFLVVWPIELIWVEVKKLFRDDLTDGQVIFLGQIKTVSTKGRKATVTCVGFEYFLSQKLPILTYQNQCNWRLYSSQCGLSAENYAVTAAVVVSSDGLTLTADAFGAVAAQNFAWGYVAWEDYRRPVTGHPGTSVNIRYPFPNLVNGDTVTAYAGCDHTLSSEYGCTKKFGNQLNFGGYPYIPATNPVTYLPSTTQTGGSSKK